MALISFHEAGFLRELLWKRIKHNKMDEKAIDGWLQFDYVLDLAKEVVSVVCTPTTTYPFVHV